MAKYSGSCHCGEISFNFNSRPIEDGMRCSCSICKRKGAVMTNFTIPPADINIHDKNSLLSTYQFGSGIAKHYFCSRCGIFTFVATRLNPGELRVNVGCIDGIDSFTLPIILFDGNSI
ncbi:MAG: GFA family protein [Chloroflexota bacterium]